MRKLSLAVIGFFIGILNAHSQSNDSSYISRRLKIDEINFVTSYYHQDGDLSPVTGGIGTEKLSDYATTFEVKLTKQKKNLKHEINFELGVDHYTSASSDKIDPTTISSASSADTRIYPSASWTINNQKKNETFGLYASYSHEFDYTSYGAGVSFTKNSADNNREFTVKLQGYLDNLKEILPIEIRTMGSLGRGRWSYPTDPRNSISSSFTFSQVINKRLQIALLMDIIYQQGYLGTPFHRIYFKDGGESNEHLPSTRFKLPIGIRVNYFAGDKIIFRAYYRYYSDDWGLTAHTASLEMPVKINSFLSLVPFYRFYRQNGVKYFAPYMGHLSTEQFYTTDDDLSPFNTNFEGIGIRYAPAGGVFKIKKLNMAELRYGHYQRTDGLHADEVTLHLKVKM